MNSDIIDRALLWDNLVKTAPFRKLNISILQDEVIQQLVEFQDNWCPYNIKKDKNNNRWGLPITSHSGDVMDNYHLNSFGYMQKYHNTLLQESDFTTPTEVYYKIPELRKLVDLFNPDIGRVHLLRVDTGGYFPPHRDFQGIAPEYFRICCVFGNCKNTDYVQILGQKPFYPDAGDVYFVNFQISHSVISFTDNLYNLILTVKLNQRTHDILLSLMV
jgi:hypothetical protein